MKIWECEECGHATSLSYTDDDVERVAEALWESMPGEGKPWAEAADYSKDQIRVWSRAALNAFLKASE